MNADNNHQHAEEYEQLAATTEQEQAAQLQQQQQQAVVLLKKMIVVLEQKETFPLQTRNKTDELVEHFLTELRNDVHSMFCDNLYDDPNSDNYRGLDSERDTEAEVEAILRVFPEVLTILRIEDDEDEEDDDDGSSYYPIQLLALARDEDGKWRCNVKAVSFIPILAIIAIEFDLFEEYDRGGLLCDYGTDGAHNVCIDLMISDRIERHNQEHHESVDTKYLQVLIRLRKLGLLKKEDIQWYSLLRNLCRGEYFAKKRFRFLVEWDPTALLDAAGNGSLPLHYVPINSTIRGFKHVFEAGIRYYPEKKGISLLFKKNDTGITPFQYACKKFGHEKVMEVVEDTLAHCYASSDNTPPLNIEEALLSAAIDNNIHLDCVYFLLRRQPDILRKLLSSSSLSPSSITTDSTKTIVTKINQKKRKRKDTKKNNHDGT